MKLRNQINIPEIGFGTYKIAEKNAIETALKVGYRLFDSAKVYKNEQFLKEVVAANYVNREELFITSKVWPSDFSDVNKEFVRVTSELGVDYLDLYLLHWPRSNEENLIAWKQLEQLYKTGKVKAIGVSNFQIHHLEYLKQNAEIFPMINQVECHLNLPQYRMQSYLKENGALLQSYCSLMSGNASNFEQIVEVAKKHEATPEQICLAWLMKREVLVIPRSQREENIINNFKAQTIILDDDDMLLLKKVNQACRYYPDPDNVEF